MKKSFGIIKNPFASREHNDHDEEKMNAMNEEIESNPRAYSFEEADDVNESYADDFGSSDAGEENTEAFVDAFTSYPKVVPPSVKSVTVISSDAQITGDLKTQGDLNIMGTIEGNVEVRGNMNMSGTISGNIVAGSALISGGKIEGDFFNSEGLVKIDQGAELKCNMVAGSLETSGSIVGDIEARESVIINGSATVSGNIISKYITVKEGAKISGSIKIGEQ